MKNLRLWTSAAAIVACCGSAFAQVSEVEPNDTKAAANAVTLDGVAGGTAAQITGTTTGSSTTVAGAASADYWRVKTAAAPLGIYRHVLTLSSTITGHTVTLRGLSQSGGVIGTGDNTFQTGSTLTSPPRFVVWYGFGKQEEIYYRVTGGSTTTAAYTGTLATTSETATVASGNVFAGPMIIRTSNSTGTQDNELWVYDSNFNAIPGAGADNVLTGAAGNLNGFAANSGLVFNLTPGTYYVAVAGFNLANNQAAAAGDFSGTVLDFPNAIGGSLMNISGARDVNVGMTDTSGNTSFSTVNFAANSSGVVRFVQFTVVAAPIPTGTGSASPNPVAQGASTTLTVTVTPPPASNLNNITSVVADISSLTGNASPDNLVLTRNGVTADWTGLANVAAATTVGTKSVPFTIVDSSVGTPGTGTISVSVIVPPPANDQCSTAAVASTGLNTGNNANATSTGDPVPTCQTSSSKGVWYVFTPASSGVAVIDTEGSTQPDTILTVFGSCGGSQIACDDDSGTGTLSSLSTPVTAGTPIYIMVSSFGAAPAGGAFNLNIVVTQSGACCNNATGVCTIASPASCTSGSVYQGNNTLCSPNPCPQPAACCLGSNACVVMPAATCTGTYNGTVNAATSCSPNPCGASANQDCATATALSLNQLYVGNNSDDPSVGGETPAPSCQSSFSKSVWFTFTAPASAAYRISTCGSSQDSVLNVFTGSCTALTELATDTVNGTDGCDDDSCAGGEPGIGGINGDGLAADIASTRLSAGQTYIIRLSTFGAAASGGNYQIRITAVNALGSCCLIDGGCLFSDSAGCPATFTAGGVCSPNTCPSPNSVCCRGATCSVTSAASCTVGSGAAGATFVSGNTTCNVASATTPCCYANYNKIDGITIQDIFDFLNDWFAASPYANTGGDGTTPPAGVNSIFDFLNAWFAGGC